MAASPHRMFRVGMLSLKAIHHQDWRTFRYCTSRLSCLGSFVIIHLEVKSSQQVSAAVLGLQLGDQRRLLPGIRWLRSGCWRALLHKRLIPNSRAHCKVVKHWPLLGLLRTWCSAPQKIVLANRRCFTQSEHLAWWDSALMRRLLRFEKLKDLKASAVLQPAVCPGFGQAKRWGGNSKPSNRTAWPQKVDHQAVLVKWLSGCREPGTSCSPV